MHFTTTALAAMAMLSSSVLAKDGRTYAIVRHSGKPIVEARMDPIVNPGAQSGHTHSVFGGTGFSISMDTDTALNAKGTTAVVNGDRSNYWFPKLFFEAANGTFFPVQVTQVNTYYFFEATDDEIKAFPPGLRMLVGDPFKRSAPYTSESVLDAVKGQDTIQPVQFTCPRSNSGPALYATNSEGRAIDPQNAGAGVGFPDYTCDAIGTGLRYDVHFPSCYNPAVDVADYKHNTQYPSSAGASGGGKQNCPAGWIHTPHLFLEAYFDQTPFRGEWEEGTGKTPWRLAQGDPYGFGLHADFISGWDTDDLQAMIDTCNAGFDGADKCPNLPSGVNKNQDVTIADPYGEKLVGPMDKLFGCNPIQWGPQEATMYSGADCAASVNTTEPETTTSSAGSSATTAAATTAASAATSAAIVASSSVSAPAVVSAVASVSTAVGATTNVAAVSSATPVATSAPGSDNYGTSPDDEYEECEPDEITTTVVTSTSSVVAPTVVAAVATSKASSTTASATFPASTGSANITLPGGWKSKGCFADLNPKRALKGINLAYLGHNVTVTPSSCATYCEKKGFSVSGTEYGTQCFCDNQITSLQLSDSSCDMVCKDGSSICGGRKTLSVAQKISNSMRLRY